MTEPRRLLLGSWPPEDWRRDDGFPLMGLRKDLLYCLLSRSGEVLPWELPAMTPAEVLARLNWAGPPLDHRALPMIEAVLEAMFADGIVGRIPPPKSGEPASYVARDAPEAEFPRASRSCSCLSGTGGKDRPPLLTGTANPHVGITPEETKHVQTVQAETP